MARNTLASTMGDLDPGEAVDMHRQVIAAFTRVLSDEHPDTIKAESDLVRTLRKAGRVDEAITVCRDTLTRVESALGADNMLTVQLRELLTELTATDP
jgi:hypothetical protein